MRIVLIAACLGLALASCGGNDDQGASIITGTVVEVDARGLTDVESFVVSEGGERYTILITKKTELDFPPAHLNEHRISGDPVRVEVDKSDGRLVATQIGDG